MQGESRVSVLLGVYRDPVVTNPLWVVRFNRCCLLVFRSQSLSTCYLVEGFIAWRHDMRHSGCAQAIANVSNICGTHAHTVPLHFPQNLNSVAWVRERTVPTERPPLVREVSADFACRVCHVVSVKDPLRPYSRLSRPEPLLFLSK
jgi:hypothetical protein